LPWWKVIRLTGTSAPEIGRVQAHDADEAIKIAIEQYEVAPAFRDRLMAYQVRR
jgi:hypothetical protein